MGFNRENIYIFEELFPARNNATKQKLKKTRNDSSSAESVNIIFSVFLIGLEKSMSMILASIVQYKIFEFKPNHNFRCDPFKFQVFSTATQS